MPASVQVTILGLRNTFSGPFDLGHRHQWVRSIMKDQRRTMDNIGIQPLFSDGIGPVVFNARRLTGTADFGFDEQTN